MNMKERYNGWSNYQTRVTFTWLANDENTYFLWKNKADNQSSVDVASELKNELEEEVYKVFPNACLFLDLLLNAIDEINFIEVIEGLKDE